MLELYQSEACPDCTRVRVRLAALKIPYIVRTVPMDRARRQRVIEAGGRPDIPLLVDPERGRTTYEADEVILQLGATDFFVADETPDPELAQLEQHEGEPASGEARRALDEAGIDYVCRPAAAGAPGIPRLVRPDGAPPIVGADAIREWARPALARARGGGGERRRLVCPYCGEEAEIAIDPAGEPSESWFEDCPVCCRPWSVLVERQGDRVDVRLARDDD